MNYELPKGSYSKGLRVLSFDPGTVNMGVSCVELRNGRLHVLCSAVLNYPIHDIPLLSQQRLDFINEVQAWITCFKPKGIVAERFQSRGLRGSTVECVSMMLGMLSMLNLPFYFITASTCNVVPHILDSALIGCYGIEQGTHRQISFTIDSIIDDVESVSLIGYTK